MHTLRPARPDTQGRALTAASVVQALVHSFGEIHNKSLTLEKLFMIRLQHDCDDDEDDEDDCVQDTEADTARHVFLK